MSALSQDSFLNAGYPLFYPNEAGGDQPVPVPPIPIPPVPLPPPIPEPPVNTPGNYGIGGTLVIGAFNQNIIDGDPRPAGSNGQLQITSIIDEAYNCWNQFLGTLTYTRALANGTNAAVWIAGAEDAGGIEIISGVSTTANTYNTQVNITADLVVAGSIKCAYIQPTNPPGSGEKVNMPTIPNTPGGTTGVYAPWNVSKASILPLAGYSILQLVITEASLGTEPSTGCNIIIAPCPQNAEIWYWYWTAIYNSNNTGVIGSVSLNLAIPAPGGSEIRIPLAYNYGTWPTSGLNMYVSSNANRGFTRFTFSGYIEGIV